ncbi:MAG: DNA polymerase III subunit gamma/tau [Muribaculaceae bacterium]|nr:DNA polymerase III subunit gamma/tau [Muribaculaceae bacterium]
MEKYLVSARKYRPSTFNSVVGQKALTATLRNSIATDRLAHAYLFCGSRGVGKTSCARIFAKTINCTNRTPEGDACNECESCRAFNENRSLNIIELDAASNNSVDDIRALVDQVQIPPTTGRYRVFIVDEVHMLSQAAFNAFLKTLEEPPGYVVFILATTEKHKIIPTILSRCQIYDFNRITIQDMVDHLTYVASQEGISVESSALNVIARKADGAMRDALSIFDQVAASSMGNITYQSTIENLNILDYEYYTRLLDAFLNQDVPQALLIYKEIREKGFDSLFFINGLASHLRDLMVARDPKTLCLLEASDEARQSMAQQAVKCSPQFFYKAMALCNDADLNYRTASNKQFLVELLLIKLCQLLSPSPIDAGDGEGQLKKITPANATPQPQQPQQQPQPQPQTQPIDPAPTATVQQPVVVTATYSRIPQPIHPPQRRTGLKTPNISLKGGLKKAEDVAQAAVKQQDRNNNFSDQALDSAWETYISSHPTAHILINTMRVARPQRIEGNRFVIMVENPGQVELMKNALPDIISYLANQLSNDHISFEITINEGESSPHVWNSREVFAHMLQEVPHMQELVKRFDLTLS